MKKLWKDAKNGNRVAIVDFIAYVVLAFCMGLATSIALGGVVLLLAHDPHAPGAAEVEAQNAVLPAVHTPLGVR